MIPVKMQIGNKAACEDAPPVVNQSHAIVCDGMGGAGSSQIQLVSDKGEVYTRTNAYIGSRIVSYAADIYLSSHLEEIKASVVKLDYSKLNFIINGLKDKIISEMNEGLIKYNVEVSRSISIRTFPTTLAAAVCFQSEGHNNVLTIWTGDSRVYALTGNGLLLLTQDDTPDPDSMTTDSKIINKISAGHPFTINYALYSFDEPLFIFACSDGCFDYIPSPLNYEWLLIRSILDIKNDGVENIGELVAESIKTTIYPKVYDDTTIAGFIIGFSSLDQMKAMFQNRMNSFEVDALDINDHLNRKKELNYIRNSTKKAIALSSDKVDKIVHDRVVPLMVTNDGDDITLGIVNSLPEYINYKETVNEIVTNTKSSFNKRIEDLQIEIDDIRALCKEMIISDHMKWKRILDEKEQNSIALGSIPFLGREVRKPNHLYLSPEKTLQILYTYIRILEHPDYQLFIKDGCSGEYGAVIKQLENFITLFTKKEKMFVELWSQAYFSTRCHKDERERYCRDRDYNIIIDDILLNPHKYEFLSVLTRNKIASYSSKLSKLYELKKACKDTIYKQIEDLAEMFWKKNKGAMIENFMALSRERLVDIISINDATFLEGQASSYSKLREIDARIKDENEAIDVIWNSYKKKFQYYNNAQKRGVSDDH